MGLEATLLIGGWGVMGLAAFLKGIYECKTKKNPYGETPILFPWGIFVWGDAVVIGLFWFIASMVSYLLNDAILFSLILAVFWGVRSLGETTYWFNQQFSTVDRNPPKKLRGHRLFENDSIWFVYQITHQCITVISIITSIYLAALWIKTRF